MYAWIRSSDRVINLVRCSDNRSIASIKCYMYPRHYECGMIGQFAYFDNLESAQMHILKEYGIDRNEVI